MTISEYAEEPVHLVSKRPPQHYLLTIESLSLLKAKIAAASNACYLESSEFTAAGHRWVLSVYIERDKEDNGDDHVSIYARMIDHQLLAPDRSVNMMLRFFVYNHIRRNYHVTEVDHLFSAIKTESGVPKFVSQDEFYNLSKGFLVNDRCAFGIEMFVLHSNTKFASLTLNHKPKSPTYTWTIPGFSKLPDEVYSPTFTAAGCSWKLHLYPVESHTVARGSYISLYLHVDNVDGPGKKALVEFELCLKSQLKAAGKNYKRSGANWFPLPEGNWGWRRFMALSELNDPSKGYKVDDTVIAEVTVISVFVLT